MRKLLTLLSVLLLMGITPVFAQNIDPALITSELNRRGLTEAEVRAKLKQKNIDVDNIAVQDLPRLKPQIEAAIAELEKEKQEALSKPTTAPQPTSAPAESVPVTTKEAEVKKQAAEIAKDASKDIKAEIKKGASLDEAVSESLINKAKEDANLEPAVIYGQQIFRNNNLGYIKDRDFKAPDSYVLSTGDKITITISNTRAYYNKTFEIDREGNVPLENMPRQTLKGLTLGTARKSLYSVFSQFYPMTREDFSLSVAAARIISVNITGEVTEPGTYTLSAGNSAFNALVAAQGPTNIGSVRNIQLIRTNGEKKRLDVYDFLLDPSVAQSYNLFENDYIHIPVTERVITVQGAVRRPNYKYELIKGENLMQLITYAGGLTENAYTASVQVKRFIDNKEKIIDINYADLVTKKGDFELLNGDVLVVRTIPESYKNFVEIQGAVDFPGKFELDEQMRVSDVLLKAVLKKETRRDLAYLFRLNANNTYQLRLLNLDNILNNPASPANIVLLPEDRLVLYTQERFTRKDKLMIDGAVRTPSEHPFDPGKRIRVSDLINLAGGLMPSATAFAYITHTDTTNSKIITYENIDIEQAVKNPGTAADMVLKPNDYVFVFSKESFVETGFIRVSGSVRAPGEFKFAKGMSLKEVLTMSNGLKLEAATNRVDIYRIVLDSINPVRTVAATIAVDSNMNIIDSRYQNYTLEPYDQIVVRSLPEFSFQKIVNIVGEVKYPGPYALLDKNEKLTSIIQRAGGLGEEAFVDGTTLFRNYQNTGYIIMNLKEALSFPQTSQYNVKLNEGDLIEIPKLKDFVTIQGATKAAELYVDKILNTGKINVPYTEGKKAWYYVDNYAAGVSKDGRRRLISVFHPNGEVKRTKHFLFFKFYPQVRKGSLITVGYVEKKPEKPKEKEEKRQRSDFDWRKATVDIMTSATSILTIALLLRQLNK